MIGLHLQLHKNVILHLHKLAVLDKHKVSLTIKWLTRVASLHIIALGRPVLPEVACFGPCVSEPSSAYNWQILRLDPKSTTYSGYEEIIRSLNHLLYISSDQSHTVKTSYINRLSKTLRLFSRLCENCNIKTNVHSQLLVYTTSMSSYIWFSRWSAYIYNYIKTLYCTCTNWLYSINTRFHSLSNDWPASPVFT